jgi:HPt (histidine-containing phosphotransfer) domain-containing protein
MGEEETHQSSGGRAPASNADLAGTLERLRESYRKRLPEKILAIRAALDDLAHVPSSEAARGELLGLLHNLAGSGATFGYPRLGETARALGTALAEAMEQGPFEYLSGSLRSLVDAWEEEATKLEPVEMRGQQDSEARSPLPREWAVRGATRPYFSSRTTPISRPSYPPRSPPAATTCGSSLASTAF